MIETVLAMRARSTIPLIIMTISDTRSTMMAMTTSISSRVKPFFLLMAIPSC